MQPVNFKDITGQKFGRLTAVKREGKTFDGKATWLFLCDCGGQIVCSGKDVRSGDRKSCGCLQRETVIKRNLKHGFATRVGSHPLYSIWAGMINRCCNPNEQSYPNYGGRGIVICDRWRNSFPNFLFDMGERPSPYHSLDRINNNGNYEPSNCRWALTAVQANNKRNNTILEYNGVRLTIAGWAIRIGVKYRTLAWRIFDKWSDKDALTSPFPDSAILDKQLYSKHKLS